jgi:hypothetical protein
MSNVFNWSANAKTYISTTFKTVNLINGLRSSDKSPFTLIEATRKDNGKVQTISFGKSIDTPKDIKSWIADAMISELEEDASVLIIHLRGERAEELDITDMFA